MRSAETLHIASRWAAKLLPAAAAVMLTLFGNAFTPVNTDLGWTLAFGRDAFATGAFPWVETYSFTEPGSPLVMTEWGSGLLFFVLHRAWGAAGLIGLKWVLAGLTVVLVYSCVVRAAASPLVRLIVCLVAANFMWIGFELVRAQLFTL
ncbi:MAG: hypothetical protein ACYC8T_24135, partial [Myxococcaceae bacterium]